MTVNEMIAELERERDAGHGEVRVMIYETDFTGFAERVERARPVRSVMYIGLRPYARNFVELV